MSVIVTTKQAQYACFHSGAIAMTVLAHVQVVPYYLASTVTEGNPRTNPSTNLVVCTFTDSSSVWVQIYSIPFRLLCNDLYS